MAEFEIINDENLEKKIYKRDLAIKYLGFVKSIEINEILNRPQCNKALEYLLSLFKSESTDQVVATMTEPNQEMIIAMLVDLIKAELKDFLNSVNTFSFDDMSAGTKSVQTFVLLNKLTETLELLSRNSNQFCIKFHENSKLKDLCEIISIIKNDYTESVVDMAQNQIKAFTLVFLNLSRFAFQFKDQWYNCELVLLSFQEKFSKFDYLNWLVFLIGQNVSSNFVRPDEAYTSNLDFLISSDEPSDNQIRKCYLGFKYFKYLNEPQKILGCSQAMNIIYYVSACSLYDYDIIELEFRADFIQVIISLISYLYDITTEYVRQNCQTSTKKTDTLIRKNLVFIEKTAQIIQNMSNRSFKFCLDFNRTNNALKCMLNFIQSDCLSEFLVENLKKKMSSFILKGCYDAVIGSLHNLSRAEYKDKKLWQDLNSVQCCINFSEKLGAISEKYRAYVYMIISNIASDSQIDSLPEIKIALQNITDLIKSCTKQLEDNEDPLRIKVFYRFFNKT